MQCAQEMELQAKADADMAGSHFRDLELALEENQRQLQASKDEFGLKLREISFERDEALRQKQSLNSDLAAEKTAVADLNFKVSAAGSDSMSTQIKPYSVRVAAAEPNSQPQYEYKYAHVLPHGRSLGATAAK